jgi:predicted RNase H-like HicB family nuclease
MKHYAVVIEKTGAGFGAYVPDLPGCVSTGRTIEETDRHIHEAIEFHLDGMREDGDPIPEPTTVTVSVEIPVA